VVTGGLLALLTVLAAVGLGSAAFLYVRREPRVPERPLLLALRAASLLLLLGLVVNPPLPGPGEDPVSAARRGAAAWTVVDPDPALLARDDGGASHWEDLLERAALRAGAGDRLARVEGDRPDGVDLSTLQGSLPDGVPGNPGAALLRLAELGADSLVLLSPLRRPSGPLEEALARLPIPARVERIGGPVRNAALAEFDLPLRGEPGEGVEGSLLLVGEGTEAGDSVQVEVTVGGEVAFRETRLLPQAGAPVRIPLNLTLPPDSGNVRVEARAQLEADAFPADDVRVRVVRVGGREGGVVMVSLQPDWEPRTLLPVLERATGLEGEGFLRVGPDRFLPLVSGGAAVTPASLEQVVARGREAALLVLHGAEGEIPEGVAAMVQGHPRVLHLPRGPSGARLAGANTATPLPGEWMIVPEPPPSPLSPFLSGRSLAGLPPLRRLLPPAEVLPGIPVLHASRGGGGGEELPVLLLREEAAGRRGVALASDFWRWGVRDGEPREVYRNLWAGMAGWLLALERVAGEGRIRPAQPVLERGRPQPWEAPGHEGEQVEVAFRPLDGDPEGPILRRDSALVGSGGGFTVPELPPGRYRWEARGGDGPASVGEVEVEPFLDALLRPPGDPERLTARVGAGAEPALAARAGRPLRTHPLPWLLLLGSLCGEWVLRRRAGLR
jgi:hypothetical protein